MLPSPQVHNLGVTFDQALSLDHQTHRQHSLFPFQKRCPSSNPLLFLLLRPSSTHSPLPDWTTEVVSSTAHRPKHSRNYNLSRILLLVFSHTPHSPSPSIRDSSSLATFKKSLKTHFFSTACSHIILLCSVPLLMDYSIFVLFSLLCCALLSFFKYSKRCHISPVYYHYYHY